MKNTYFQANLTSMNKITAMLFTAVTLPYNPSFFLQKDDENKVKLNISRHMSNNNVSLFELDLNQPFEYGHRYVLILEGFPRINVDVSNAVTFANFDELFTYDGNDLGAVYSKEETSFALWAPLASEVGLKLEEKDGFSYHKMSRGEKGVYRITIKGDLLNRKYHFYVNNSGIIAETNDPWGKGVSVNSEYSAIVDPSTIKKLPKYKPQSVIKEASDAVIYETSVRDFTEDKNTNIENKGKYLGMVEENRKTVGGNPAGLDYLKYLGISHVQILPVIDFATGNDLDPQEKYNWGYDPISLFALEGSYAKDPITPMARLYEFREMVDKLHQNDIRVVMDVVYNHLYEFMYTSFEKVVPGYFFRKRSSGLPACASGCGDDFASEKPMARKAIKESLEYFTDVFDIDGFRFDLMGLLDIETINSSYQSCKKIKEDILFYGEGWNMGVELPFDKKACAENADKMPNIGFFNDTFRNVMKGGNFKSNLSEKGFVCGLLDKKQEFNYVMLGSCVDNPCKHRFLDPNQSLNYIECHDNNTLFDKLLASNVDEDVATLLQRVEFANTLILFAVGMPFIHMGQEIGQSKSGLDNTYNVLKINNMDWKLVDERFDMVERLSKMIAFRRKMFSFFEVANAKEFLKVFETQYWDNEMIAFNCDKDAHSKRFKKVAVLVNPTKEKKTYELDDYYSLVVDTEHKGEKIRVKNGIIPPLSIQVIYLK